MNTNPRYYTRRQYVVVCLLRDLWRAVKYTALIIGLALLILAFFGGCEDPRRKHIDPTCEAVSSSSSPTNCKLLGRQYNQ